MNDSVSIIVPVYNVEKYVSVCIDSIVHQSYRNIEIILVDDGSTDKSGVICDKWQKKDRRIKVIHKKNGGLSSARNVGLDNAHGEYISFIDSDDFIKEDMLSSLIKEMKNYECDIVCCNYFYYSNNNKQLHNVQIKENKLYSSTEAINNLFYDGYYKFYAWNKLYKRSLFGYQIRYPEGKLFEDITTTYKLFKKSNNILFLNRALYFYRVRQNSITNVKFNNRTYEMIEAINYVKKMEKDNIEVRVGCILYQLFFLNNMLQGKKWDKKIYDIFKKDVNKYAKNILISKKLSEKRKLQILVLAYSKSIYGLILDLYK